MRTSATALTGEPHVPLRRRVLAAGAWSLAGYAVSQVIRFGSNLVMTRLLVPEMFGVMAIATIVMVGLAMFSDLGLRQSIVQSRRGDDPVFLNTAWALQILRGLVLWVFALAIAAALHLADHANIMSAGSVYADPSLPWVISVVSFGTAISGFSTTKSAEAGRNLTLGRLTQIELAAQLAGLCVMLAWAWFDRSIWALAAGSLASAAVSTAAGHVWLPGTPNRWQWDLGALKELLHFGKWIFFGSMLGFLVNNGDRLLMGAMVDTTVLGVYVIAFFIVNSVEQALLKIVSNVTYPALSHIVRNRPSELKARYYRIHGVLAPFAYFCAGALILSGPTLIQLAYDPRYSAAGWMVAILSASLMSIPMQLSLQCFMALGRPQLYSTIISIRLVTLVTAMPIGFAIAGVSGSLWGIVVSYFSCIPALMYNAHKHSLFDWRKETLALAATILGMGAGKVFVMAAPG